MVAAAGGVSKRDRTAHSGGPTRKNGDVHNDRKAYTAEQHELVKRLLDFDTDADNSLAIFDFVQSVATGRVPPVLAADCLKTKFVSLSVNSWQIYKILDVLGFMLEDSAHYDNVCVFLESMQRFRLANFREIVSSIDAPKLDACNYSTGLTTLSVRERTRDLYVLGVYSLFRECSVGIHLLNRVLYLTKLSNDRSIPRITALKRQIKRISGSLSICATRTLYELMCWLSNYGVACASVTTMLEDWPNTRLQEIVHMLLYHGRTQVLNCPLEERPWRVSRVLGRNFYAVLAMLIVSNRLELGRLYPFLDTRDSNLTNFASGFFTSASARPITLARTWNDFPPVAISRAIASATPITSSTSTSNIFLKGTRTIDSTCIAKAKVAVDARMKALEESYNLGNLENGVIDYLVLHNDPFGWVKDQAYALECGKLKLTAALLDLVDPGAPKPCVAWGHAKRLLLHFDQVVMFPAFINGDVCRALCCLISRILLVNNEENEMEETFEFLIEALTWVGCGLYVDPKALDSLLRFLEAYYSEFPQHVEHILERHVIPAVSLCTEGNVQITSVLWQLLKKMTPSTRYKIYLNYYNMVKVDIVVAKSDATTSVATNTDVATATGDNVKGNSGDSSGSLCTVDDNTGKRKSAGNKSAESATSSNKVGGIKRRKQTSENSKMDTDSENAAKKEHKPRDMVAEATIAMCRYAHLAALHKSKFIFKRVTYNMLKSVKTAQVRGVVSLVTGIAATVPLAVAECILSQCEMFENLVAPLTEVAKYFTKYACDVFFFILTYNAVGIKRWDLEAKKLNANAQVAAKLFKRHCNTCIEPLMLAIIQKVAVDANNSTKIVFRRLDTVSEHDNDTFVTLVVDVSPSVDQDLSSDNFDTFNHEWLALEYFGKLLEYAGGVAQLAEAQALTNDQLCAQAGGPLLKYEIMTMDPEDDHYSLNSRDSLANILARPLFSWALVALCGKIKHELVYDCMQHDARIICQSADQIHRVFLHLLEFLEAAKRPHALYGFDANKYWDAATSTTIRITAGQQKEGIGGDKNPASMVITTLPGVGNNEKLLKEEFLRMVACTRLQDIWVPQEQYAKAIKKIQTWINASGPTHNSATVASSTTSAPGGGTAIGGNTSVVLGNNLNATKKQKRLRARMIALERELEGRQKIVNACRLQLSSIAQSWLVSVASVGPQITAAFVKHVLAPRILISESEALYCAKLVDFMIDAKVPYFNFFDIVNCWTKMLVPIVGSCTQREAPLLAIFTSHQFATIKYWSEHGKEFEQMSKKHPCFCTTFKFNPDKALTLDQLIKGIRKWEGRILRALCFALDLDLPSDHPGTSHSNHAGTAGGGAVTPDVLEATTPVSSASSSATTAGAAQQTPIKATYIGQKAAIVFLARCHESFPITQATGKRILDGLVKVANECKQPAKDIALAANTLVKTYQKYHKQRRWIK